MTVVREPTLKPVNIEDLRPTQITVGMREVEAKRKRWREKGSKKELKFLEDHMIPVILGPRDVTTLSIIITSPVRSMKRGGRMCLSLSWPT